MLTTPTANKSNYAVSFVTVGLHAMTGNLGLSTQQLSGSGCA